MLPRIHIRGPSDASDASEVAFVGTGNEFIDLDTTESPRQRHLDHEEHFHGSGERQSEDLQLRERVRSWSDEAGFGMEEKKSGWDVRIKWYKVYGTFIVSCDSVFLGLWALGISTCVFYES